MVDKIGASTRSSGAGKNPDADNVESSSGGQDFEAALSELEALVATMEDGTLPLESSLLAYKRGVELVRVCQDRLERAEQQVKVLEGELLRPLDERGD